MLPLTVCQMKAAAKLILQQCQLMFEVAASQDEAALHLITGWLFHCSVLPNCHGKHC